MKSADDRLTEIIREKELGFFLDRVKPNSRILEIGAGSGFQASRIAENGHRVDAVDVRIWSEPAHPVTLYDGSNLPFEDDTFDYVFSSNVLEHVPCSTS